VLEDPPSVDAPEDDARDEDEDLGARHQAEPLDRQHGPPRRLLHVVDDDEEHRHAADEVETHVPRGGSHRL
jgi:hypothetical protein